MIKAMFSVEVRYRTMSGCNTRLIKVKAGSFSEAIQLASDQVRRRRGVQKIDGGHAVLLEGSAAS